MWFDKAEPNGFKFQLTFHISFDYVILIFFSFLFFSFFFLFFFWLKGIHIETKKEGYTVTAAILAAASLA